MPTAKVPVLETLQEYADSRGVSLSVDAAAGVIKGVKILGRSSPNQGGREYPADVMRKAIPLYEGRRVNVDHPADQKQRRSYRDRIGAIFNVLCLAFLLLGRLVSAISFPLVNRLRFDPKPTTLPLRDGNFRRANFTPGETSPARGPISERAVASFAEAR